VSPSDRRFAAHYFCDTSETALTAPLSYRQPAYYAIMKTSRAASSPLRVVLLASVIVLAANALAQTDNPQASTELPRSVAGERCLYAPSTTACAEAKDSAQVPRSAIDDTMVAQLPRRGPGHGFGPRGPMGRPAYPGMWGQPEPSGRHALIGAVIGGLLGCAVAAKGNAGARATLGIATVGAGLGAAFGLSVPSFPSRNPYWHRWPDDDEDAATRKFPKPRRTPGPQQTASADPTPSRLRPDPEDALTPKTAGQP